MSQPFRDALVRALIGALLTGAGTGLAVYTSTGTWRPALVGGATAAVAYMVARGGAEGWIDSRQLKIRQAAGASHR
jgi:hypothetical protein